MEKKDKIKMIKEDFLTKEVRCEDSTVQLQYGIQQVLKSFIQWAYHFIEIQNAVH